MDTYSDGWLIGALIILILASAFFSSSETGMVAINRYRLRHLARQGQKAASRVEALLKRTDRLLSVILIGNNFVNNFAATVAAILAIRWLGDSGAAVGSTRGDHHHHAGFRGNHPEDLCGHAP